METQNLNGKVALVIGGTKGMGKGTAALLAERGAHVIIASKKQESVVDTMTKLSLNNSDSIISNDFFYCKIIH